MKRLIVFGCSFAYGFGLHDCSIDSSKPSKFSWPVFIAQSMNRRLVNNAKPASSNKRIWYTINRFKFQPDDIVIISWTVDHRSCIIKNPWNIKNLIKSHQDEIESFMYYEHIYSRYDSAVMFKLFVRDANNILRQNNIKVYNLSFSPSWKYFFEKDINFVPLHIDNYLKRYPTAPHSHLGYEGNRVFAADFMKYIGIEDLSTDIKSPSNVFQRIKNKLCKLI